MSIMTIRQKIIRVSASAAICGLSISFAVGEIVDQKAHALTEWTTDAKFFPKAYTPLQSLIAGDQIINSAMWKENLAAVNSAAAEIVVSDKMTFVLAAPKLSPAPKVNLAPVEAVIVAPTSVSAQTPANASVTANTKNNDSTNRREVEKVLLSIHDATASLNPGTKVKLVDRKPEILVSEAPIKKSANEEVIIGESAELPKSNSKKQPDLAIISYDQPSSHSNLIKAETSVSANRNIGSEEVWQIQGRILYSKLDNIPPGHFEVGIYSKIDPEGLPIGAPIFQQTLSLGKVDFKIEVPKKMERTFLFGEFVAEKSGKRTLISPPLNPIDRSGKNIHFAELNFKVSDAVTTVAAATTTALPENNMWRVGGRVTTMFVKAGEPPIAQEDVVVKVRGRKESTRTDKSGAFTLELPKLKGEVALEFLKTGYHPTIMWVNPSNKTELKVDLASRDAVEKIARSFNSHQVSSKGVFIGKSGVGLSAQMSLKAEGPYYFGENGFPDVSIKSTTNDGRFIFFNIEPGIGFMEASMNGENIAPMPLSVVEGGQLISKHLVPVQGKIKGRLFNPVATNNSMQPISGARVRLEGASEWSNTDSYGAFALGPMKFFQGEKVSVELSAEKFFNHRYSVSSNYIEQKNELNLFAFPAAYVNKLAASMDVSLDSFSGIILGKVSGLAVRVDAMAEHSTANGSKDFYFDGKGRLQGSHAMTDPRYGTFMIFNVPKGNTLLHGNNGMGQLQFYESVASYPASISVIME